MLLYDEDPKYNKTSDEINDQYGPREGIGVVAWLVGALVLAVIAFACWLAWG